MLFLQGFEIDIRNPGIAAEDKQIPYQLKALTLKNITLYTFNLFVGQIGHFNVIKSNSFPRKGIICCPPVINSDLINFLKYLQHFHGRIMAIAYFGFQKIFKIVNKIPVDPAKANIIHL